MNVQDVIEQALAGNDGIPVTPVEHSSCEDVQIEKLASALNFIGTSLESSVADLEKVALDYKMKDLLEPGSANRGLRAAKGALGFASLTGGAVGENKARKKMQAAGLSEAQIDKTLKGSTSSGVLRSMGGGAVGALAGLALGKTRLAKNIGAVHNLMNAGATIGTVAGGYSGYRRAMNRADAAIAAQGRKKTASVDDVLYHAAQVGKQSLLEKVAEDRINPAKISAGPADPYSGEIMPNAGQVSNEFVGNTRDHHALIALKAQKVRNRINKDMKQYVTNVGDGYNLQGHLSKMNK